MKETVRIKTIYVYRNPQENKDEKRKNVKLTEREISTLKLIILGKSNKEIAAAFI
jgi:DNA-binding NarL/FixJ family response regulator